MKLYFWKTLYTYLCVCTQYVFSSQRTEQNLQESVFFFTIRIAGFGFRLSCLVASILISPAPLEGAVNYKTQFKGWRRKSFNRDKGRFRQILSYTFEEVLQLYLWKYVFGTYIVIIKYSGFWILKQASVFINTLKFSTYLFFTYFLI